MMQGFSLIHCQCTGQVYTHRHLTNFQCIIKYYEFKKNSVDSYTEKWQLIFDMLSGSKNCLLRTYGVLYIVINHCRSQNKNYSAE